LLMQLWQGEELMEEPANTADENEPYRSRNCKNRSILCENSQILNLGWKIKEPKKNIWTLVRE
jgi:hypothetical protein